MAYGRPAPPEPTKMATAPRPTMPVRRAPQEHTIQTPHPHPATVVLPAQLARTQQAPGIPHARPAPQVKPPPERGIHLRPVPIAPTRTVTLTHGKPQNGLQTQFQTYAL